jgi:hypothetical protein
MESVLWWLKLVEVVDARGRRDLGGRGRLTRFWWVEDLYGQILGGGRALVRARRRGGRDGTVRRGTGRHLFYAAKLGG